MTDNIKAAALAANLQGQSKKQIDDLKRNRKELNLETYNKMVIKY